MLDGGRLRSTETCLSNQGRLDTIDTEKAVDFVLLCMNHDGGFGCRPSSESHSGQVLQSTYLPPFKVTPCFSNSLCTDLLLLGHVEHPGLHGGGGPGRTWAVVV